MVSDSWTIGNHSITDLYLPRCGNQPRRAVSPLCSYLPQEFSFGRCSRSLSRARAGRYWILNFFRRVRIQYFSIALILTSCRYVKGEISRAWSFSVSLMCSGKRSVLKRNILYDVWIFWYGRWKFRKAILAQVTRIFLSFWSKPSEILECKSPGSEALRFDLQSKKRKIPSCCMSSFRLL